MLRLRTNLQPRISNHLAVLSAVLLLVSSIATSSNRWQNEDSESLLAEFSHADTSEVSAAATEAKKAAARKAANISLMIFRHN